jgi:hypothetical protein
LDPKTATKERGEQKFVVLPFFVATKINKIENYINLGQFIKNYRTFYPNNWHPGSGKTYSGSRIQGSNRHRIPHPDPQY